MSSISLRLATITISALSAVLMASAASAQTPPANNGDVIIDARLRYASVSQDGPPLTEAEVIASYDWLTHDDYREGLAAFAARRKPEFTGR